MHGNDDLSDQARLSTIHKVLECVPSMLAYWDTDMRCRFANGAYKRWFGVDADSLVGTSLVDLLGPELFALNEPYVRAALRGEAQSFQRIVPGPDGVLRPSLAHYLPDIVDGQVRGFVVQVTDVTPLKDVEAALRAEAVERERAGDLLRKSEAALKQAQRLVRIGSWHWEVCPDVTSWSEELYRIFGRDPARLAPSYAEHAQLYTPQSWLALQAAVARTLSVGDPYVLELEYLRPDGATGWVEARGEAERDDQGTIIGLLGTAQEITARRDARLVQRQLATSEHFRERLEALTPGVVHIFDLEQQRNVYISRSVASLLGYSPGEVGAMGADVLATLMHPEDRSRFPEHLEHIRLARDDETADFEFRMRNRAGQWRWFQSRDAVFSRDDRGAVRELIGTAIDIDSRKQNELALRREIVERKQVEEALRQSTALLRAIGDTTGDVFFAKDIGGRLTYANPATTALIGKPLDEVLGRTDAELLIDEHAARQVMANDQRVMTTGVGEDIEELVPSPDGTPRTWLSRKVPYRDANGNVVGLLGVSRDITEHKRSEAALRASEAFSRLVLENSPDCVQILDSDGRLAFMNRNGQRLMAFDDFAPLKGRSWELIWPDTERARVREAVETALRGEASRFTATTPTASGQPRRWDVIVAPISAVGQDGGPVSLISVARDITAQTEAEQKLHLRDRAIAASDAGVFIVDPHLPDAPIVYASEGFERMTGYMASEVLGLNCRFLQGRDTDAGTVAQIREAVHALRPVRRALINYRKDGTPFWNDIAISPVTDAQGRVTHLVGIQNDVSAMYALQAALQASKDRLALGVQVAKLALAEIDYESDLNHLTPEAAMAFGLGDAAQVVPREQVHATFHPDDKVELARRIAECLDPAGPGWFAMDHRIVWPDGTVRWLTVRKQVFFAGEGTARRPQRAVLAVRDVTDQKRVDARLLDSLTRVQLATEATAVGIWEWNVLNDTIRWDAQMFRLYGIPPTPDGVLLYSDWTAAVVPDDLVTQERILQDTAHRGGQSRREFRIRRRVDGQQRDIEAVEVARRNAAGTIEWVLGTNLDITERKDVERQLQRAAAALTDADRRKDEFLATLSHELRNPLAPVSNSLQLLKRARGDAVLIERAQATIERQLAQLVRLIDDLLDVSRITRDKLALKRERTFLSKVVHDAVELCQPHFDRAHQTLSVTLPTSPVPLHADPARLIQVLGNLLNNASKYTPRGGHVALVAVSHPGHVVVTVRDNGIGIAPDMKARVFDLFAQVDSSHEMSLGGLGIGLALARRLAEMHGGTIAVRSDGLGFGSEFVVTLPVMQDESDALAAADSLDATARVAARRILVVDDNQDSAQSMAMLLELDGHQTLTAHDGQEALDKASTFRPDVVLLDIGLPKLGGYEVCRRLRQQPWGSHALIIAVTGWGQAEDLRKSAHAGFDSHCVKPVAHDALTALILQSRPAQGQSA